MTPLELAALYQRVVIVREQLAANIATLNDLIAANVRMHDYYAVEGPFRWSPDNPQGRSRICHPPRNETLMTRELNESLTLIKRIHQHFADEGWQPLLPVKVNGLRTLSQENLRNLLPKVTATSDRVAAVTAILEAVIPGNDPPESPPDFPKRGF